MYKLCFICNDSELINIFKNIEHFEDFNIAMDIEKVSNSADILIVSDRLVSINKLLEERDKSLKTIKNVFYMVSGKNLNANTHLILDSNNITMIPPKLTAKQIVDAVCNKTLDGIKSDSNVIVFSGADSKVGTTMVAQSVAERIVSKTNLKVFLGFFDGKPGTDYIEIDEQINSLDAFKVKLANNVLRIQEFLDSCYKKENLYIIQGVTDLMERRFFQPEHIEYLIKLISKEFDVIILDAGSNIDLGYPMTIACLNSTNYKYLVTTQQDNVLRHYDRVNTQILNKLKIENNMIIVNKYVDNPALNTAYRIAELYNCTLVSTIPYMNQSWQCESDRCSLMKFNDDEYIRGIDDIVKLIFKQLNINRDISEKKKTFLEKFKEKITG